MDFNRFDMQIRSLAESSSRRGMTRFMGGVVLGGALRAFGLASFDAEADKRHKRRRHKKHQNQQPAPHVCQGRNACVGSSLSASCGADPSCFCFVTDTNAPICAKGNTVDSCAQCEQQFPGRLCFANDGPNCGAFSCVDECPV